MNFSANSSLLHIETFVVGPLPNNLYLLRDDATKQVLVIDPSIESDEAFELMRQWRDEGFTLSAIWNTHGHFDHIYENARWHQEFQAPIWMHDADNFLIEHLREQCIWLGLPAPEVVWPQHNWRDINQAQFAGHQVQVLAVPGHSPGSVAFHFTEQNVCISGDVVFANGGVGRTDLPGCDANELQRSLQVLAGLPAETKLLTGHGEATTVAREFQTRN